MGYWGCTNTELRQLDVNEVRLAIAELSVFGRWKFIYSLWVLYCSIHVAN